MRVNEKKYYNLTHPQKRVWYIDKINEGYPIHNIGGCLKINKAIDVNVMKETINFIIKTNDGLRLQFDEIDGQPVQWVKEYNNENIDFLDFSISNNPEEDHKEWAEGIFKKNFQLENDKLYYFGIYKISEYEYGVLLNIHHIISDGWSISLIQNKICEIYDKLLKNQTEPYNECYSYLDYIEDENEYLKSERFSKNKNFWKEKLSGIEEEALYKTTNSLDGERQIFNIDNKLSQKINEFKDTNKCSLNTFFIATLLIYMNKVTYKKDLVIGTPVFNRTGHKQKNMVGMFTSTVPFRFELNDDFSISNLIKAVNRELKICFLNQKYPYDLLVKDLDLGKMGYDSLFKMCVNYYNSKYTNDFAGEEAKVEEYYSGTQSYSLQLTVKEWQDEKITLNFDYKKMEYSNLEIQKMYHSIINITNQILANENIKIKDIKLISEEERNNKLYKLNSTSAYYPGKMVYELFEEEVAKIPNKIAVEFNKIKLTYKELNEKSNQFANHLREKGVNRQSIIAIMENHSEELLISILGVLKAGAAYLPIDPSYPIERINYMLEDSESVMLLTNFEISSEINFKGIVTNIKDIKLDLYDKENLSQINQINDLAYIIYTSGSTGKPKGVMIEHRGLTNYIWWANKTYLKNEDDVMALYSSISFDLTVTSIFTPLISGHKIVVYDNDDREFVLYKILREDKATVVKLTPAHLTLIKDLDNSNSNIKRFIVGGEDLKVSLAKEIYKSFNRNVEICNEYGPTETVVGCMIYKYDEDKDKGISVPIGYPADNVQVYILDNNLNMVQDGFVGEIYISGDGVARGYLNREELTCERFITNPFLEGKRMYRTGDTARYLENGAIEYVGRIDNQVKIRGHRIELGEIEKYLLENEAIKDGVVVFKEDKRGNKVLNAYIVSKKQIDELELKNWLLKFLPKYMLPTNFIFMESLPLTVNGKVNYSSLPDTVIEDQEFIASKNDMEIELVKAMEEILGTDTISMNDNYYQLGGDSIKAIQISSKLKNMGLDVKVKDILAYDSISEIAATIDINESFNPANQEESEGFIDSTPIEKWFFSKNFKNENLYNQYVLLEVKEVIDASKVEIAVARLIKHHDVLRINYDRKVSKLYYNNEHLNSKNGFNYIDLSQSTIYENDIEVKTLIEKADIKFNIESSLLFNVTMFNLGNNKQCLLFTGHHLVVDGVSWRVILNDFIEILEALEKGEDIKLAMKTHSFKEWAKELAEYSKKDFKEEIGYWNSILNEKVTYPMDFNNEEDKVKTSVVLSRTLDESTLNLLMKNVNEVYSIDINETLIIALVLAINNMTLDDEVVIELERHGREAINDFIDVSRTVGWFTSMYPSLFKIESNEIDTNIKSLKEQIRNIPNKGFNYGILKFISGQVEKEKDNHVRFNYLGDFDNIINTDKLGLGNIEFGLKSCGENSLTALIDISAMIVNKELKIDAIYSNVRFKDKTIEKLIDSYICTLKSILNECVNKESKEFTPSDFDAVDISQDDLDALFN